MNQFQLPPAVRPSKSSPALRIFLSLVLAAGAGCEKSPGRQSADASALGKPSVKPLGRHHLAVPPTESGWLLTDVTQSLGLSIPDGPYPDGQFQTPEIAPGGVALFDFDNDGRLDVYQVCHCPPGSFTDPGPNRLFRQTTDGRFEEVPDAAGLADPGFGHGIAVGDIDNDGDLDVFVTNYGPNALYLNQGNGKFANATQAAGLSGDRWSTSAGFLDYDRDGDLDLYVVNFALFDPAKRCTASDDPTHLDYCGPHTFPGVLDTLYRNNGDGSFTDVTAPAGINQPARGWGLACADVTGDGWCDVYIANDEEPAQLWVNQHDGTFQDEAVLRGCAFNAAGRVEAGMGVGIGDVNGDQKLDLFKTHIAGETNTLYLTSPSNDLFTDTTTAAGMGAVDRPYTGWGCGLVDLDHDGDLDVAVACGRVRRGPVLEGAHLGSFWNRFAEPCLLFENIGDARFENLGPRSGSFGSVPLLGRGMAFGDIDNDGDLDLVVASIDNSLRVFRNDATKPNTHWLCVRTITGKRDAYGAIVVVEAGGRRFTRLAHPTYSYLASNDPRAHFGLGPADRIDSIVVHWPSGATEQFSPPSVDQVVALHEGEGHAVAE